MVPNRVIERLLANVGRDGDCTVSLYATGSHGYSQIGWWEDGRSRMVLAHRVAWEVANGPIPDAMTVDHTCRNRRCINVSHLRLLTNTENARLNGNKIKTHCKRGHEFTPDNTRLDRRGHRRCRQCERSYRRSLR